MTGAGADERAMRELIGAVLRETAGLAPDLDTSFFTAGITSAVLVQVHERLVRRLDRDVPVTALFKYPTRRTLARYLCADDSGGAAGGWTGPASGPAPSAAAHRRQVRTWIRSIDGGRR